MFLAKFVYNNKNWYIHFPDNTGNFGKFGKFLRTVNVWSHFEPTDSPKDIIHLTVELMKSLC